MSQARVSLLLDVLTRGTTRQLVKPEKENEKIFAPFVAETTIFTDEEIKELKEEIKLALKQGKENII